MTQMTTTNQQPQQRQEDKMKPITIKGVRILKYRIKFAGKYVACYFWHGDLVDGKTCWTISAKSCLGNIPAQLGNVENNSDMMTDYFENDRVRLFAGTESYAALTAQRGM